MKNSQKGSATPYLVVIIALLIIGVMGYLFYQRTHSVNTESPAPTNIVGTTDSAIKITSPRDGEALEVGEDHNLMWTNSSNEIPASVAVHMFSAAGVDEGYKTIISNNIPPSGTIQWNVPMLDSNLKYQLVLFDKNRNIISNQVGYFTLKDDIQPIVGAENVVINPKLIFSLGSPVTITGVTGVTQSHDTSLPIYSTSKNLQPGLITVSIENFNPNACEIVSNSDCKNEQAVRLKFTLVTEYSSQGKHYVAQGDINLTSITKTSDIFGSTGYQYKIELKSLDIQKQQATLVVQKI